MLAAGPALVAGMLAAGPALVAGTLAAGPALVVATEASWFRRLLAQFHQAWFGGWQLHTGRRKLRSRIRGLRQDRLL